MNTAQIDMSLDGFVKHLQVLKGLQPSSVSAYASDVREFFTWLTGNAQDGPLEAISHKDIEQYLLWCYRQGNQDAARATKLIALQNFFRYLIYNGELATDPTAGVPRVRTRKAYMQTFNRNELLRMFASCDRSTFRGLRDAVMLVMGAFAGFRVSEIWRFNIEQVSDDGKDIDLVIPKTKRGAGRTVYLWKAPGALVRELVADRIRAGARTGDPLLVSCKKDGNPRGGHRRLTAEAVNRALQALAKKAGLRKAEVHNHMLRATHACDLPHINGYQNPRAIMERLGIKRMSTLEHYLVRRDRVHRTYRSLHEYWQEFTRLWVKEEQNADRRPGGENAAKK